MFYLPLYVRFYIQIILNVTFSPLAAAQRKKIIKHQIYPVYSDDIDELGSTIDAHFSNSLYVCGILFKKLLVHYYN